MPFFLQDGRFLSVDAALNGDYGCLINGNEPAFRWSDAYGLMLRFEVSRPIIPSDEPTLISCSVAGIPVQELSSELADTVPLGGI